MRRHADDLWTLSFRRSVMGMELGARTTIVRLPSGGLALISPGPFSDAEREAIRGLGEVEALIAPNTFHHLYLRDAARHFPEAAVYLAPGLREKVSDLPKGGVLTDEAPERWREVLDQRLLRGTRTNEVVFFHRPSGSLVLTDLAFNIHEGGLWTRLALKLNGAFGRLASSRIFRSSITDEAAFQRSLRSLFDWDFDRIVVAHGAVLEQGGKQALRQAFPEISSAPEGAASAAPPESETRVGP